MRLPARWLVPDLAPVRRLATIALLAILSAGSASAQETRGGPTGNFDFYVLALTWSPGFCELEGDRKSLEQCGPGRSSGFTVHGLWPQFERGYPTECGPAGRSPPRAALDEARSIFPEEGLARHQWRKHGTCSGKGPAEYFRDVRRALEQIRIPARFRSLMRDEAMMPAEIERAFEEANPGLGPDMMGVACRRRALQEVRICLERDLRGFRRCPGVDRSGCGFGEIRVNAIR